MACALCGDLCRCPAPLAGAGAHVSVLIDPEHYEDSEQFFSASIDGAASAVAAVAARTEAPPPSAEPFYRPGEPAPWRDEVASRVDAFRSRRGRPRPNPSLAFNFEAASETAPEAPSSAARSYAYESAPPAEAKARYYLAPQSAEPKVIEFPKPALAAVEPLPRLEELAEPIVETPRILDVPEGAEPLPTGFVQPLVSFSLDHPEPLPEGGKMELPLPVAPLGPRISAALIDALAVLTASAIFAMTFLMIAKEAPQGRAALVVALLVPGLLWAVYQYVFLVYAGATPGMQMTQVGLAHFREEAPVTRRCRRIRALAMLVSGMSLGMGFAWALLDEDRLGWHDRISHTYLVNQ